MEIVECGLNIGHIRESQKSNSAQQLSLGDIGAIILTASFEDSSSGVFQCSDEICDELLSPMSNRALQRAPPCQETLRWQTGGTFEILEKERKMFEIDEPDQKVYINYV